MATLDEKKKKADELASMVEKLDENDIKLLAFGVEMLQARKIFESKSNKSQFYKSEN